MYTETEHFSQALTAVHSEAASDSKRSKMSLFGGTPRVVRKRGETWSLYFPEDDLLHGAAAERIENEDVLADASGNMTRAEMLRKCDGFLSRTRLLETAIRTPADVLVANHTLRLPFSSLTPVVRHVLGDDKIEPLFNDRFEVIHGGENNNRPALMLDCLAYTAHEDLLNLCRRWRRPVPARLAQGEADLGAAVRQ